MLRVARGVRLRVKYCSFSHKTDFTKRIDLKRGSKVVQHGHSVAAVISDDSKVKKAGKRVTKDERRARVETYIMKYKAMNNGKFPNTSNIQKEVGGSYYVIKGILQEMEYRSKTSPINIMHEKAIEEEATDDADRASADVAEVSISHVKPKKTVDVDDVISDAAKEEPKASTPLKKTIMFNEEVVKPKNTLHGDGSSNIGNQKHEPEAESEDLVAHLQSIKRKNGMKESKGPHPQIQQHKPSSESFKHAMGNSEKQTDEEVVPKQQSMWRNLRSLADGIMKIWRGS